MFSSEARFWRPPDNDHHQNRGSSPENSDDAVDSRSALEKIIPHFNLDPLEAQPFFGRQSLKLSIVKQPEEQHRARYLSEGSRGAIKDRSGNSYCTVQVKKIPMPDGLLPNESATQLRGYCRPTRMNMFIATGSGPVVPHSLYRAIPIWGKGGSSKTTPCRETVSTDGISCLEIILRPEFDMTAMAVVPNSQNPLLPFIMQVESSPIMCMQQLGMPEVVKMSLQTAHAQGGGDLFIVGRNFDRNTIVVLREYKEDGKLAWTAEAIVDRQLLHQTHIVCSIPTYRDLAPNGPVEVSLTIKCGRKSSHPVPFYYTSDERIDWTPPTTAEMSTDQTNIPNDLDQIEDLLNQNIGHFEQQVHLPNMSNFSNAPGSDVIWESVHKKRNY